MTNLAPEAIAAIDVIAAHKPHLLKQLSPVEILTLASMWREARLRPIQIPPSHDWRFCGYVGGRGFGKSLAIAAEITDRVKAGSAPDVSLMAPSLERVEQVQFRALIDVAPPWFRPIRSRGELEWPNGARTVSYTPEAAGRPRGENTALSWLTEIVDWVHTTRREAFDNLTTATRIGCAQVFWDTTSKGRNDLITLLVKLHEEDPFRYPIIRGTTFDNPLLSDKVLQTEWRKYSGVRRQEELFGAIFSEAAGALWQQIWIDENRASAPAKPDLKILGIDPALSDHATADAVGMCRSSRVGSIAFIEEDLSEKMKPEVWGDLAITQHLRHGVAGALIERNHLGDNAVYVLRSRAREHNVTIRILDPKREKDPMPRYTPGVLYVREIVSSRSKETRASGPASETERGNVKFCGTFSDLENELTTWEPGTRRSPNRLDACVFTINELLGLDDDHDGRRAVQEANRGATELKRLAQRADPLRIAPQGGISPLSVKGRGRRL